MGVVVLFANLQDALDAKAVLERERKNNKYFTLSEFKFHKMHTGNDKLQSSLKRVLTKLSKTNVHVYAVVVEKPKKHSYAFDFAKGNLISELFSFLCSQGLRSQFIELKADNNFFGSVKSDHARFLCYECIGADMSRIYTESMTYETFKKFMPPGDIQLKLNAGYTLGDWNLFTIKAKDSSSEHGIQIADLIAGSIFQKYNNNNDVYFNIINPIIKNILDE